MKIRVDFLGAGVAVLLALGSAGGCAGGRASVVSGVPRETTLVTPAAAPAASAAPAVEENRGAKPRPEPLPAALPVDLEILPEPARPADSFVAMIGVATHWGYNRSVYGLQRDKVQGLLGELGVRIVRDGMSPQLADLWKKYGIQAIVITGPDKPLDQFQAELKAEPKLVAAVEGPNEVNTWWKKSNQPYQGKGWPDAPRLFQNDLNRALKDSPDLKEIPVLALSTAYKGGGVELAPLTAFDYANTHSYPGGAMPSTSLDFRDPFLLLGAGAVLPPLAASETGYHTCLGNSTVIAGKQPGISHEAHRKYIPRLLAEYFNAGFHWTVIYELAAGRAGKTEQEDPEAAFGLLLPDATPKPAYFALKSLIATLGEAKWDPAAQQWTRPAPFAARALAFALPQAPVSLHHTLLQRADGTFQLLLWNEVSSFDTKARKALANRDVPVRLVLHRPAAAITVTRLGPATAPVTQFASVKEITVNVPDEVVVVGITPAAPFRPVPIPSPAGLEAKAASTSVELVWPPSPGADAWWVTLSQRQLGRAKPGADGKLHFTAGGLLPGLVYPFEITAASLNGDVSAPAKISVATDTKTPDLVVKKLKLVPASPRKGDKIGFAAVVANIGTAPVDAGVIIGIKFGADGKTVCWDTSRHGPLAPGQEVEITANSSWVMSAGSHKFTAFVDDVNRIIEANEGNNILTITAP